MINKNTVIINVLYQKIIVIYLALMILGNSISLSLPYYFLLIISILAVFFSKRTINATYIKQYLFIIILAVYGMVVAVFNRGGVGGPLTIITGMMVCYATQEMKFDKNDLKILVVVMCISTAFWLYRSPTYYSEFFYNHWKGDGTYINANGVGHYLNYQCSFMFIILSMNKKKWVQWVKWIIVLLCIWGCYNVRARMELLALILFVSISWLLERFPQWKKGIIRFSLIGAVLLEIVFPHIYLWMYKSRIGITIQSFGLAEKGLYSGRQYIWQSAFDEMQTISQILFGIGSKQDFWQGHNLNMHNNAMNLIVVTGIVGLVVYFVYLIWYIFKNYDFEKSTKFQLQCLVFFICVLVAGTTDITIFYNDFLGYYFIPLGIALSTRYYETKDLAR